MIDNGVYKLRNDSTTYDSVVEYSCNDDYWMVGTAVRSCTKEGKWSSDTPSCECKYLNQKRRKLFNFEKIVGNTETILPLFFIVISCEEPEVPSGGMIIGYDFNIHSKIEFKCEPGYLLKGQSTLVCNRNGLWSEDIPSCQCKLVIENLTITLIHKITTFFPPWTNFQFSERS